MPRLNPGKRTVHLIYRSRGHLPMVATTYTSMSYTYTEYFEMFTDDEMTALDEGKIVEKYDVEWISMRVLAKEKFKELDKKNKGE